MNKFVIVLSVIAWAALTTFSYASALKIEISLNEHSELKKFDKNPASLIIATKITNISSYNEKISVWLCSYGSSWVASSPAIITGLESCTKNFETEVILKPGESYKRDLYIALSSKAKIGSLTFQMGFNFKNDWFGTRIGIDSNKEMLKDVIWSNPIIIEINNAVLAYLLPVSDTLELKSKEEFQLHGVKSQCTKNDECWCRNFNGSYFIEGRKPNTCDTKTHFCAECIYK